MISLAFRLTSYVEVLEKFSELFQSDIKDHVLQIPPALGSGYLSAIDLGDITALFFDNSLNDDIVVRRERTEEEFYSLNYDELSGPGQFIRKIGLDSSVVTDAAQPVIFLSSYLENMEALKPGGLRTKGLRVGISKGWMKKYLKLGELDDVLEKYIRLKTENIYFKPIDAESRELLHSIIDHPYDSLLSLQNKILRIVEIFFDWMYGASQLINPKPGISRSDIRYAQKVESILTAEEVVIPPTIKELARSVAMSESKLKKVFKAVYNLPIYEYFQKHRMQKAKLMLLSERYAIKDVGYKLGYANLSNFTLAFKKIYGKLPSDLIKGKPIGSK